MRHDLLALALSLTLPVLASGCEDPAADAPRAATTPSASEAEGEASAAPTAEEEPVERVPLAFDQSSSSIGFVGSKVTGSHEGGFEAFTGTVHLAPERLEDSRVEVRIDTRTLFADEDRLTRHLRSEDFFDVGRFPEASFTSTRIEPGAEGDATHTVTGDLTLHGVTRSVTFPATIRRSDDGVSVDAEFSINRKDFDINYPGMPNDLIRDLVLVKLDVNAREGES